LHNQRVSSPLARVPIEARRKLAATLGLFGVLFVAIGAVAATGRGTAAAPVFSAIAMVMAVLVGLMAWGIVRSIRIDLADQRLDAAIEATIAARGGHAALCDCGHEHDPDELHITDCGHDGAGTSCAHDCETCVLAALRPSPTKTRAERRTG
jgi:hypothetical protein